jgi:hypothetical protein
MYLGPEDIRSAVARTVAQRTARVVVYAVPANPTPDANDLRGTGVVEYSTRRAWVSDRLVTRRGLEATRRRGESRLLRRLKRGIATETEFYFDGGRRYVRGPDGTWTSDGADPAGAMSDHHPSWPLHLLSGARGTPAPVDEVDGAVGKTLVLDAEVDLSVAQAHTPHPLGMPPGVSVDDPPGSSSRYIISARVWLTGDSHIWRVSVASRRHVARAGDDLMWFASEFDALGEPVSVVPPTLTNERRRS